MDHMPESVLIATLGDHPAVITSTIRALKETAGIEIKTLHVLYTEGSGKDIAQLCFPVIEEHLRGRCVVRPEPLPFPDPNSEATSIEFLRILDSVLRQYQNRERFHIYLSLAGGRKNTSALLALAAQFYPSIKGLYHLIDTKEDSSNPSFPVIEDLVLMPNAEQLRQLEPPLEDLRLISIPYPAPSAGADQLWHSLENGEYLEFAPEVQEFFGRVTGRLAGPEPRLRIKLSEQAKADYDNLGAEFRRKIINNVRKMQNPHHLQAKTHGASGWKTDCEVYPEHKAHDNLRLFYFWNQSTGTVTICRAMLHQEYDRKGALWVEDHPPAYPISALKNEVVLVVPLGKSPMVASQTYTLFHTSENEGCPDIPAVAVVYPGRNPAVENGVRLLKRLFENRRVRFLEYPVQHIKDIDSEEACCAYLDRLLDCASDIQEKYPHAEIGLSLSGGRKGMSALSLIAAQRMGIERVYHTLITDIDLEKRIEHETSGKALDELPSDEDRASRLFLEQAGYDHDLFELFSIPVVPFRTDTSD